MLFRFLIASMTAILVVSVMSMALNFVIAESSGTGVPPGGLTGRLIQTSPQTTLVFMAAEFLVGLITFFGSLYVLSKK
jgi:hypothetical protein